MKWEVGEMTFYLQGQLMDVINNKHTRLNKLMGKIANILKLREFIKKHLIVYNRRQVLFCMYVNWKDYDYLISVLSVKFYTCTSIQWEENAMEIEVSIDKFVIDYKDVPHSTFLRVYMVGVQKYKVKMKIDSGTYSYELHMRKSDDVYTHLYFKNFRET